jgi:L-ribulose-5-phosphate 4-epimerase
LKGNFESEGGFRSGQGVLKPEEGRQGVRGIAKREREHAIEKLKEDVFRANIELVDKGLVFHTFGNVSGINREFEVIAIKPSGVDYEKLAPENIVLLDLDGNKLNGDFNPSSDTKTHLELYRAFSDIGGIVHTHSSNATAWAQAKRAIPCLGTTHADYFYGEIPCTDVIGDAEIIRDYEDETGKLIVNTFRNIDHKSMKAVLVACHGPFTWGKDAREAVFTSAVLEEIARMAYRSISLNSDVMNIKQTLLDKHFLRKHGRDAYYGQKKNI